MEPVLQARRSREQEKVSRGFVLSGVRGRCVLFSSFFSRPSARRALYARLVFNIRTRGRYETCG